jgi:hypothetical protein
MAASDNKNRILVTFVDDADGEILGETKLKPEELPETFEAETTLRLEDEDWLVVSAEPATRAEFVKTKKLTLRLGHFETVDPQTILYSLPSITNELPACGDQPLNGNELTMLDDSWRQLELVSRSLATEVDQEMEGIHQAQETKVAGSGWESIHVRKTPVPPIAKPFPLTELLAAWEVKQPIGLTFYGAETQVDDGFAVVAADGQAVYGVAPDGLVAMLGIAQTTLDAVPEKSIAMLTKLAEQHELDLVHWCRCSRVASGSPLFRQLLVENAS